MLRLALLALVGATAALRVAPLRAATASAAGAIRMGAAVGDKLPSSVLSTCGVSGKKAVIFFYGADDAPSCSKEIGACLLYTSPSPRDRQKSRMPSSA